MFVGKAEWDIERRIQLHSIDLNTFLFHDLLRQTREYNQVTESFLLDQHSAFDDHVEHEVSDMTPDERRDYIDAMTDHYVAVGRTHPRIFRHGVVTVLWSSLERYLSDWVRRVQRAAKLPLRPSELRGSGVRRSCRYLKAIAGLPIPDDTECWRDVCLVGDVRNLIVHGIGAAPEEKQKLNKMRKRLARFEMTIDLEYREVDLSPDFAPSALKSTFEFSTAVDEACKAYRWGKAQFHPWD